MNSLTEKHSWATRWYSVVWNYCWRVSLITVSSKVVTSDFCSHHGINLLALSQTIIFWVWQRVKWVRRVREGWRCRLGVSHGSNLDVLGWRLINDDFTLGLSGNFASEKIVFLCVLIPAVPALTHLVTLDASIEADAVLLQAPKRGWVERRSKKSQLLSRIWNNQESWFHQHTHLFFLHLHPSSVLFCLFSNALGFFAKHSATARVLAPCGPLYLSRFMQDLHPHSSGLHNLLDWKQSQ